MAINSFEINRCEGGPLAARGFKISSGASGVRKSGNDDLMLLVAEKPAAIAAVYTKNKVSAWCVQHNKDRLSKGKALAILCSAGNANCCNGESGKQADLDMSLQLQQHLSKAGYAQDQVFIASTGVIGRKLPVEKILNYFPTLVSELGADSDRAAKAIMTTDLVPKSFAVEVSTQQGKFRVGGIAKGSGMIAPNMATMLGFVTTDLQIASEELQAELAYCVDRSFNCISVDGDTSTNDMCFLMASAESGIGYSENKDCFRQALLVVLQELAKMIARDGEGATKLVTVKVKGAATFEDAQKVCKTIAESPLVKTACFGNDPNWGRILAAAGRSGVEVNSNNVAVSLAGVEIFRGGEPTSYDPNQVSSKMKTTDLEIIFEFLNSGEVNLEYWTCDFSYDYVKINADYGT
jgi:glutamate N-acetyltransferase/amino-acid N-acetyltransferase